MKKGRHRRFEEARKLKQSGPGAFDLGFGDTGRKSTTTTEDTTEEDDYAALAEKYGVTFDDDDDSEEYVPARSKLLACTCRVRRLRCASAAHPPDRPAAVGTLLRCSNRAARSVLLGCALPSSPPPLRFGAHPPG